MNSYLVRILLCMGVVAAMAVIFATVPVQAQILRKDGVLPALANLGEEPFGLAPGKVPGLAPAGPMWVRWREFEAGVTHSIDALARCRAEPAACSAAEARLVAIAQSVRHVEGRAKLGIVNREINLAIAYTSDTRQHAAADIWSSALSTFDSGQGDCEDFAIAKYVALREAGVPASDLRLLVGRLSASGTGHAVLAARLDGRWLILDNRRMAMIEDVHASDLRPLFAFDHAGVREYGAPITTFAAATRDVRPASDAGAPGDALPALM